LLRFFDALLLPPFWFSCSLSSPDTKDLTRECVGGSDLQQRKKEIEAYNETTARNFEANMQEELHGVHTDGQGDIA